MLEWLLLAVVVHASPESRVTYHGAQVIRISSPVAKHQQDALDDMNVNVWSSNKVFTDIMVDGPRAEQLKKSLLERQVPYKVIINNVQALIDRSSATQFSDEGFERGRKMSFNRYHRLNEIHDYIDMLAQNYSDIVTIGIMGYSVENRPLKYIKISSNNPDAKAFFIDGGIHAREWISPAATLYMIKQLVENRSELPKALLDIEFYILPVVNPDGYEYTFTTNRLWRKNRSRNSNSCRGVDLNRNFGFKWGGKGTSGKGCSEIYRGPGPFSEPESKAVADFIMAFKNDIEVYISLHSYSQLILLPFAYDKVYPENFEEMKNVADHAADAMLRSGGVEYKVGNTVDILYEAAGGSFDWAKAVAGVRWSFTLELRDTGRYGFLLPAKEILPTSKEIFEAVKVIAGDVTSHKFV